MRAIMVMFDSLNRRMLEPYGCDWVHTPNFARLADRTVTFDRAYVGSMACMPARRELHTGRYNFLHRSWGPLEPFDDSMPLLLRDAGVYTHHVSDHYHYREEGGSNYHTKYQTWNCIRGQEGDPWIGQVADPEIPPVLRDLGGGLWWQDWINRPHMPTVERQPQHKTMSGGMDFIRRNADQDNWFLQIETFDPHEPYFTHEKYKDLYPHAYDGDHFDWPRYAEVTETPEEIQHLRYQSAALHSMCDDYLGRVLDLMDELDLWEDTMLIVNTASCSESTTGGRSAQCRSTRRSHTHRSSSGTRGRERAASGAIRSCKRSTCLRRCSSSSTWMCQPTWKDARCGRLSPRTHMRGTRASSACTGHR